MSSSRPVQAGLFEGDAIVPPGEALQLMDWAPQRWPVADDWRPVVDAFLAGDKARQLGRFMRERLAAGAVIYPAQPFRALALTPLANVRVVILGQDPYHGPGQAEGLAFSVPRGCSPPASLRNIFKEIARDPLLAAHGLPASGDVSLVRWALQGVLLLNTSLTVEQGQPASHAQQGWEALTDGVIKAVSVSASPVVFMLWGAHAQSKLKLMADFGLTGVKDHLVLTANHPSPLSALRPPKPFIGCGHFSQTNAFFRERNLPEVEWSNKNF